MGLPESRYALRGGQWGYDRLLVLSRERWPDTERLLHQAGVATGNRCVDLGCGGGEVTMEIANMVGTSGSVLGIDRDEVKLDLARKAAAGRYLRNVEFRQGSVQQWNEVESYDLVYSRFLLQHLPGPVDVIKRMWQSVRRGGVLVIEDADHDAWAVDPPNPGFDFFYRNLREVLHHAGGDSTIGRKLYRYFLEAGIANPHVKLVAPLRLRGEGKVMALLTLESISESITGSNLATADEVTAALTSLQEVTKDPRSLFCGPRVFQVYAKKSR
ncbi:MAG TPA: class I SAM-dependent methyltransferase [Thermoplasmata archaeon]|nr:class I SAM-dependent methyltransferase [Thermoplasmata archaeon]